MIAITMVGIVTDLVVVFDILLPIMDISWILYQVTRNIEIKGGRKKVAEIH